MKRVIGAIGAILLGAGIATSGAAPALAAPAAPDFTGIVALNNCSGSVVRVPSAAPDDPALVMSNGHCVKFMGTNEVILNQSNNRTFTLLDRTGQQSLGTLTATKLAYATMKDTDVSLYQLNITYAQLEQKYPSKALTLSDKHPTVGTAFWVQSGYWKRSYTCAIDAFVPQLKESNWVWKDSIRYKDQSTCKTIGGTSGSPLVDGGGTVIGINNTGNEKGERCTLNNPCEVDQNGNVSVKKGASYGQQTYQIVPCVGAKSVIDLNRPGCGLPKPTK